MQQEVCRVVLKKILQSHPIKIKVYRLFFFLFLERHPFSKWNCLPSGHEKYIPQIFGTFNVVDQCRTVVVLYYSDDIHVVMY